MGVIVREHNSFARTRQQNQRAVVVWIDWRAGRHRRTGMRNLRRRLAARTDGAAHSTKRQVVIPGTVPKKFKAGTYNVPCALIIGKRKESTDKKTSLNQVLREHNLAV